MSGMFGAWPLSIDGSFVSPNDGEAVPASSAGASVDAAVGSASTSSIDAAAAGKEAYVAEIEQLYLDGGISEQDYDAIMSDLEKEANSFARVMTEEEVREYEAQAVGNALAQR